MKIHILYKLEFSWISDLKRKLIMCSIVGSFSKQKFKELIKLNQSRGSFSYSFFQFDTTTMTVSAVEQNFGEFPLEIIDQAEDGMMLFGHTQAPTGGLIFDKNRIHPAKIKEDFLFHNGIIKQQDINRLQKEHETDEAWDSKLMLMEIQKIGLFQTLNTIDGSFACIFKDESKMRIFRSAAGTLFVDNELNISSTLFEGSNRIEKDVVFYLDFDTKTVIKENLFKSKSNPYFY
jgi:hypothetical protein